MRIIKPLLASMILFVISLACLAQDKNTGAIKGKVSVEKGSPSGVEVIVRQGEREVTRATTDKKGEFMIARIPPGVYAVSFHKPGLATGSIDDLEVRAGKTRSLHDLRLAVDEGSITFIRGSVFTEAGRSVAGVRVDLAKVLDGDSTKRLDSRVTGETGEFVFRLPPDAAKYRVTLKANGAETVSKDVEVDSPAVYRIALTLKPASP
ncbi:MAG TPA: carboxypeptidase-like regulatory domain-containing protein [Pyrinomonadaceae bacterium]|nr:carboxypeptidase-like regulatory domain-containing protein [Pyrinomonadaceae bacterium]